jgi:Ca2+-binding EF-hand superfamily protein
MGKLNFYPLSQFSIFQNYSKGNDILHFPDFLWVSRNSYQQAWSLNRSLRRIKNVIVLLEWIPSIRDTSQASSGKSVLTGFFSNVNKQDGAINITVEQESMLLRCFNMFDMDEDGKLSTEEITKVIQVMGLDSVTAEFAQIKYVDLIASKGGFTFGVFKEMIRDIAQQFRSQDGRFFVLLTLQEAEHFRGLLHSRLDKQLIASETGAHPTQAALWLISDSDTICLESTLKKDHERVTEQTVLGPQHRSMSSCFRFVNSDTYFDTVDLTVLLRVLESDSCEQREKWWYDMRRCRRRRQIPLDGSFPVATLFNTKDELHFMEYKAIIKRVQAGLQDKGMLIYDAFRAFNSSRSGCLSCSELYGAMEFLGIAFTPNQIYDLVKKIAVQNEVRCICRFRPVCVSCRFERLTQLVCCCCCRPGCYFL